MILTLTLAAGLLAAPERQAEPQKGWVVEVRGFTKHRQQAEPPKGLIIEFQWPQAKPQFGAVEGQYYDDLSAFFKQWEVQVEPVAAVYVDDLRAYIEQLTNR